MKTPLVPIQIFSIYKSATGQYLPLPARMAMAMSAILAAGLKHDAFPERKKEASIQCLLIHLGYEVGNIDGYLGMKSLAALSQAGIAGTAAPAHVIT